MLTESDLYPHEASPSEDAYETGYSAFFNGIAEDSNPFEDTDLSLADAWERGWNQAEHDHDCEE